MRKPDWTAEGVELYHGNCLEVMAEMSDRSVDMVFADPPYGHNNNSNGDFASCREAALGKGKVCPPRPILNDGPEANDAYRAALAHWARLLPPGACCCCCGGGGGPDPQFARWSLWLAETPGLDFKQMVVWDKGPMGIGWHYRRSYEVVLVGQRKGTKCRWYDETHRVENIIRPSAGIKKIVPRAHEHPTEKPVALAKHFIRLHTRPGDVVLDPFMGAGSTAVAAIRLGRRFMGVELDRRWFDEAASRCEAMMQSLSAADRANGQLPLLA